VKDDLTFEPPRGSEGAIVALRNALILASEELGDYCEGFAASLQPGGTPFFHAWVSRGDGAAIDVTLRNPEEYVYLGIQFSRKSFLTLANAGHGKWGFLRPPLDERLLRQLIA
jgi:hypothetical protein